MTRSVQRERERESVPYWATASNIAVLSLEKGDQVSTEGEREEREREGRERQRERELGEKERVYPTGPQPLT